MIMRSYQRVRISSCQQIITDNDEIRDQQAEIAQLNSKVYQHRALWDPAKSKSALRRLKFANSQINRYHRSLSNEREGPNQCRFGKLSGIYHQFSKPIPEEGKKYGFLCQVSQLSIDVQIRAPNQHL